MSKEEKALDVFSTFIKLYPFTIEDLEGEVWEWVKDYEGIYQVSNYSRIRSFNKGEAKIFRPCRDICGYLLVRLSKDGNSRNCKLHRLVAEAFVPNPDNKPEVHHINGDKLNCCPANLMWCTKAEHRQHSRKFSRQLPHT